MNTLLEETITIKDIEISLSELESHELADLRVEVEGGSVFWSGDLCATAEDVAVAIDMDDHRDTILEYVSTTVTSEEVLDALSIDDVVKYVDSLDARSEKSFEELRFEVIQRCTDESKFMYLITALISAYASHRAALARAASS